MPFATEGAARDAIFDHFNTSWGILYPTNPPFIAWQDTRLDTPKDNESWVRIRMLHKSGYQATINTPGNRRFRAKGTVHVEVRTPIGDGLTAADAIVNNVQSIFEGKNVGGTDGVIFREVTPVEQGPDGAWYFTSVLINFEYDRLR